MSFGFGSFITNILFSCILVVIITLLLKNNNMLYNKTIKLLFLCIFLIVFRMIAPIEFFFTHSIRLSVLLPTFHSVLKISFFDGLISIRTLLLFLWFGIALIKGIIALCKYFHFRKLLNLVPNISTTEIDKILKHLDVPKEKIQVKQLDVFSPVIIDPINPVIILPEELLNSEALLFILEHEVNHYKHHDLWFKFIIEILQIIYWWNPFVILLHKQINNLTEINNDLKITENMNCEKQLNYLTCLLEIASSNRAKTPKFLLSFAENNSNIRQRFNIVLNSNSPQKNRRLVTYIILLFTIGSFFFNFEPYYPVPQDGYIIENMDNTYYLQKDNKYYFIINGENLGEVERPQTTEFPIINEESGGFYE